MKNQMESTDRVFKMIDRQTWDDVERIFKILASIAAISGIFFAIQQVRLSTDNALRQTTLETLKPTQEEASLSAFQRLQLAKDVHKPLDETYTAGLITDKTLILTQYDSLAIHYFYGTIDKCLVKTHVRDALDEFVAIQEYMEIPEKLYDRVVRMRTHLDSISCPDTK